MVYAEKVTFVWSSITREVASSVRTHKGKTFFPSPIVIHAEGITVTSGTQPAGVTFPEEVELRNFITSGTSPPVINIPAQLLAERATCK